MATKKADLTGGSLANVKEDFAQEGDPNLTGAIGQFMGDPSTYSPDQEQLRTGAQQYHGISSEDWSKLTEAQKAQAVNSFVQADQAQISAPTQGAAEKKATNKKKPAASDTDALQQLADYLSQSSLDTAEATAG